MTAARKHIPVRTQISIQLDSFNDLFSDFDPNPYKNRLISDDFIIQAKRISEHVHGTSILLKLLLPHKERNEKDEGLIITRLHTYFNSTYQELKRDAGKTTVQGIVMVLLGTFCMVIASYLSFLKYDPYYLHVLKVIFEPAGWFLVWMGLDHLVYLTKKKRKELIFYKKVSNAQIRFHTY